MQGWNRLRTDTVWSGVPASWANYISHCSKSITFKNCFCIENQSVLGRCLISSRSSDKEDALDISRQTEVSQWKLAQSTVNMERADSALRTTNTRRWREICLVERIGHVKADKLSFTRRVTVRDTGTLRKRTGVNYLTRLPHGTRRLRPVAFS